MNHSNNKSKPNVPVSHPNLIFITETQITTEQYKDIILSTNTVASCQLPHQLNCSPLSSLPKCIIGQSLLILYASLVTMSIPLEDHMFVDDEYAKYSS
jgi:hypothetical protein